MNEFILPLIAVVFALLLLTALVKYVSKKNKEVNENIRRQLDSQGYVVDFPVRARSHHRLTRIWQFFDAPTPFSLHLSNEGVGLSVKSNNDGAAKALLTPELKAQIESFSDLVFRTGSLNGLLSVDYLPDLKESREERRVWAIEVRGELAGEELARLLKLAHELRDGVVAAGAKWQGPKVFKVGFLEGR